MALACLREKHGREFENWWREKFGFGFDCLTRSAACYLEKSPDAQAIRDQLLRQEWNITSSTVGLLDRADRRNSRRESPPRRPPQLPPCSADLRGCSPKKSMDWRYATPRIREVGLAIASAPGTASRFWGCCSGSMRPWIAVSYATSPSTRWRINRCTESAARGDSRAGLCRRHGLSSPAYSNGSSPGSL